MPWDDAKQLERELNNALNSFDWEKVNVLCAELVRRISADAAPLPEDSARRFLRSLQRKSRFGNMTQLAGALLQSGLRTAELRRRYAQSLIDQGLFFEGEQALRSIIQDPASV
jgi:hypothetical protein